MRGDENEAGTGDDDALVWRPGRPRVLVVACSDGRLQHATDAYLSNELGVTDYDRLYLPGGGGALAASGRDFLRARQMREECHYLVELHQVEELLLLFHGPTDAGPPDAACADYRRKLPHASVRELRHQQERDASELISQRPTWAGSARVHALRCDVGVGGRLRYAVLHRDGDSRLIPVARGERRQSVE